MSWQQLLLSSYNVFICGALMLSRSAVGLQTSLYRSARSKQSWAPRVLAATVWNNRHAVEEILFVHSEPSRALELLISKRPQLKVAYRNFLDTTFGTGYFSWSAHRGKVQIDGTNQDFYFISGKEQLSPEETATKWNEVLDSRLAFINEIGNLSSRNQQVFANDDILPLELDASIGAIQKASFVSRSLQDNLVTSNGGVNKADQSPVTIADFAVQAIVIDFLKGFFPNDRFIAEEDSSILRDDDQIRSSVKSIILSATGEEWSDERLFTTVDLGAFDGKSERVWVLDPIDGTKGFLRGQHYCIALALLVDGSPRLSVLGCPNLQLNKVLQGQNATTIGEVLAGVGFVAETPSIDAKVNVATSVPVKVFPTESGTIFFAASGGAAYARSLSMPLGAAYEVQVSPCRDAVDATLCEAAVASHGDRDVTAAVYSSLNLHKQFIRLDGQCKYGVVGAGAAQGNMRLPAAGYREKIWDHAAGSHFVIEAGGEVTDLAGRRLDFSQGRYLAEDVTGIIASNKRIHKELLRAVVEAKEGVATAAAKDSDGAAAVRVFGKDS